MSVSGTGRQGCNGADNDNQHVLNWAVISITGALDFEAQLAWLARILEHRAFPLDRLARSLELLATALRASYPGEEEVAERIRDGAAFISSRPSFIA